MKIAKLATLLFGVIFIFVSIWTGAYLYNTLAEGYQFASICTGYIGFCVGLMAIIYACVEMK